MTNEEFRKVAYDLDPWGIVQVDDDAKVNRIRKSSRNKGALVQVWIWVEDQGPDEEFGL